MGWEYFCVVGFDLGPLLQGRTRILHLQYFFKYVLTYSLHLNSYLVTFLHNTICRAQLFCPFLLSGSEFLLNMLFNYHLLYFCTALSLIIMLSCHYYLHKSKILSQLTQCPFTGTLLLFLVLTIFKDKIFIELGSCPCLQIAQCNLPSFRTYSVRTYSCARCIQADT